MFAWRNVSSLLLCYETRSELGYMGEIRHYQHVNARDTIQASYIGMKCSLKDLNKRCIIDVLCYFVSPVLGMMVCIIRFAYI